MDFLQKSIAAKTIFAAFIGAVFSTIVGILAARFIGPSSLFISGAVVFAVTSYIVYAYLHKPLQKIFGEIKALLTGHPYKKIFTNRIDEIGILGHFFNEVTKSIERVSADIQEGQRMSKELSVGSDIQRKILPVQMPTIPGIALFGNTRPASEVGGDSFDVFTGANNNTYVYVGDVTGHGLPAGLIMVMVNTLIRTLSEVQQSGYDIMINTNRILKQRIEQRRFMTAILLRYNTADKKLFYTGCGHEHLLIWRKQTGVCEVRQTGGIALGMVPDISKIIREEEIALLPGDRVILYSDGIVEAKNMTGEMYGVSRLQNAVQALSPLSAMPEELFTNILKDFAAFVGEQTQADDMTLIVVQKLV